MEAKKFRIGNFIQDYYKQEPYKIDAQGIMNCYEIEKKVKFQPTMYSSIELTDEWLLNFGFKVVSQFTYICDCHNDEIETDIYSLNNVKIYYKVEFDFYVYDGESSEINYVHELQNLFFALTGTELE